MGKKKLIYVSSPYTGAVVEGQVYELLEYYKSQDWFEDVLLLQIYSTDADRSKAEGILKKFTFRYKFFWQNPYYPHLYWKSIISQKAVLEGEVARNTVFHVRGGIRARYLRDSLPKEFKDLLILDEFRGLSSSELDYTTGAGVVEKIKAIVKNRHYRKCYAKMHKDVHTIYTAVSPLLCEIEAEQDGFDLKKISMHPNIASSDFVYNSEKRKEKRKELGVPDDKVLVVTSSGESGAWQKDLDIIDTLVSKGYMVLNLSRKTIDKPNVISKFLPHKEMPAYLSACDAALLWRDDVPLNNVACPSKYSEFACMGLYVIHNKTVDIATRFIKENDCGQLVDSPEEINFSPNQFFEEERKRRCAAGYKVFSIGQIAESYYEILTK